MNINLHNSISVDTKPVFDLIQGLLGKKNRVRFRANDRIGMHRGMNSMNVLLDVAKPGSAVSAAQRGPDATSDEDV